MKERSERFQVSVLVFCAALLLGLSGLAAFGIRLPGSEMLALTATLVVLGGLYLICYRSTREEIVCLRNDLEWIRKRETFNLQVVESLARAIDARDQGGRGRAERVRDLAIKIAQEMGLCGDDLETLRIASLLADIGKLAVPDHVLSKPGTLTDEELKKVRTHPVVGASILAGIRLAGGILPLVRGHHEWYDGSGYPDGLQGENIPLGARVLAVADVYNALISDRPHRRAFSAKQAVEMLEKGVGAQFDPEVVAACFRVLSLEKAQEHFDFIFNADGSASDLSPAIFSENQRSALADIAQAQRELLALFEIVQSTSASLNTQETLDLLMSKTRKILNFTTGVIFFCERAGKDLRAATVCGPLANRLHNAVLPWGEGLSGRVAEKGRTSSLNEDAAGDMVLLLPPPEAAQCPLQHSIVAPIFGEQSEVCGTISLYQTGDSPFNEDDLRLLGTVAAQASVAIANASAFEKTAKTALTDPLTGLPNARYFFLQLEQETARAVREDRHFSLLLLDIDHFKDVNDDFGHQQGDRILKELAGVFRSAVREYDIVARYGGDEFFLLLPGTPNKQAVETALRVKEAVAAYDPNLGREVGFRLQVSIGIATFPGDATEPKALLAAADKAMYADKKLNRHHAQLLVSVVNGKSKGAAPAEAAPAPKPAPVLSTSEKKPS